MSRKNRCDNCKLKGGGCEVNDELKRVPWIDAHEYARTRGVKTPRMECFVTPYDLLRGGEGRLARRRAS